MICAQEYHFRGAATREREQRFHEDAYDERPVSSRPASAANTGRDSRHSQDVYVERPVSAGGRSADRAREAERYARRDSLDQPYASSYRSRSFNRSDWYDGPEDYDNRRPYERSERDMYYERRDYRSDRQDYRYHDYDRSDSSRYDDYDARPAKRQYTGRDRYDDGAQYADRRPSAPTAPAPVVDVSYHGENDTGSRDEPLMLLLIRGLKESVTEAMLASELAKLYRSEEEKVGAVADSLRRVLIIRDRKTDKSQGFGFAEYHNSVYATAALDKAEQLGGNFTIASDTIDICFPHLGVFPDADAFKPEHSMKFTIDLGSQGARHKYHKLQLYATELMVNKDPPYRPSSRGSQSESAVVHAKPRDTLENQESKPKKRKAQSNARPAQLGLWESKAAELRGERTEATPRAGREMKKSKVPASGVNAIAAVPAAVKASEQSFGVDLGKTKNCFLCWKMFPTLEKLMFHIKNSELHATNLGDPEAIKTAYRRLEEKKIKPDSMIKGIPLSTKMATNEVIQEPKYRDRAAERRKEEARSGTKEQGALSLQGQAGKPSEAPPSSSPAPTGPNYGKGQGMLQKAGWKEGQGLGGGNGIAAPIEQSMYAAGVGLGHEGSKKGDAVEEAARLTKGESQQDGRASFLLKTKEVARQRFEKLG